MLVPLKWLKTYVDIDGMKIDELYEKFILSGSNIEEIKELGKELDKVVVGKITEVRKHPNADKLLIAKVDVGNEVLQIVTGAPNIKEGQYIPVVLDGGKLPGGVKIKKGKLRGEESCGMMCSAEELGIPDKVIPIHQRDGIYILDQAYPLGSDIREALGWDDFVIEFEITPNRPDCLSMIGMAREAAAVFGKKVQYPEPKIESEHGNIHQYASVEVKNTKDCKRYVARVITDVKVEPSPQWMQTRLMQAGVRPINNIVDVTNYVMLELGQPLHAFDLNTLEGQKIVVRNASDNEKFTTLDGVERTLDSSMLMICDAKKPVGIAGVMGGLNSEITEETKTILLESANFYSDSIRSTSKKLGLRTEASSRFEKGVDPNIALIAANRACELIEKLGAGRIVKGVLDIYPEPLQEKRISVRPERMNALLGTDLSPQEMKDILERLEMKVEEAENQFLVTVPTFRADILEEVDFVEEIARIYGYDRLAMTLPKGNEQGAKTNGQIIEDNVKDILNGLGLNEILTYSFVSPKSLDLIRVPQDSFLRNAIKLLNPLGEETSIMRTTLIPNMMEVLARNVHRNVENVKAFELGAVFIPKSLPIEDLPIEKKMLLLGMYGEGNDFYALKGVVEELLQNLNIFGCEYIPESNHYAFHPGRCANIIWKNHVLGVIGEIHPDIAENYDIDKRVYIGEIDFNILMQLARMDRVYKPLPKYPAIIRDIALIVKDEIYAKQIEDIIKENGEGVLEKIELFDVYKGKQVPEGHKSIAYSLTYRAEDRTLTDDEVSSIHQKIVQALETELDARLRE
ncbi:MAG TPA: phenylalanine--tRNA ligase subunit beta [Clostridiales bacterium]|nr:phenylalanine--tRNA ligase subunit beta [Clostridiales bacterium]